MVGEQLELFNTDIDHMYQDIDDDEIEEDRCMIIRNALQCTKCGDIIESKFRHDYVTCTCGICMVDGGLDYLRRNAVHSEYPYKDLTEYSTVEGTQE